MNINGSETAETPAIAAIAAAATVTVALYLARLYSYLLFHTLIELTTISIGFTLLILTWNARRFLENGFFNFLGIAYAFISLIDLVHALSYKGMNIFPGHGSDLASQLWISARGLQAATLCVAPFFADRRANYRVVFLGYAAASAGVAALIYSGNFPACYIEGDGLTAFKIVSEYVITAVLFIACALLWLKRSCFNEAVFFILVASIVCTAFSEISFTFYLSVYGAANMLGHYLKLAAFYLVYRAILVTAIKEPFDLTFRELYQAKNTLRQAKIGLEEQVRDRTSTLAAANRELEEEIAKRKETQEELKRMNERFSLAASAGGLGVWDWDIEKNELVWDDRMYQLYGLEKKDFSGAYEAWLQGLHPDDRALSDEVSRQARLGEREYDTEFRAILPDGEIRWLKALGHVVRDENGAPLRMTGVNFDITDFKIMEKERLNYLGFLESMDKFNQAIQKATDLEAALGNVLDLMLSVFDCDLATLVYPCDPDAETAWTKRIERHLPRYRGSAEQEIEPSMDNEIAGMYRLLLAVGEPAAFGGQTGRPLPGGLADRLGAVSQLAMAVRPKGDKPWLFAIQQCSHPRSWSDDEERLFGAVGLRVGDALTSLYSASKLRESEAKYRELNEELEKRVNERTAELQKKSLLLSDSRQALMNLVEDMNEKTEELEAVNIRLQELDRLKSMFIASMSHEFRTPLNSIIGFSSILLNEWTGPLTSEQKENLASVLRSGKHLLSLINDVIDVSKIEAGKVDLIVEKFDLRDMVEEAEALVRNEAEDKGLKLHVRAERRQLQTDRRRLLQCLLNLITNAVKFTEEGGVNVRAALDETDENVRIEVSDTGVGIKDEDMEKMFSPFVRLESQLNVKPPGTGLGLYLTKKLARELLRGDVSVFSEYGRGSRFVLTAQALIEKGEI